MLTISVFHSSFTLHEKRLLQFVKSLQPPDQHINLQPLIVGVWHHSTEPFCTHRLVIFFLFMQETLDYPSSLILCITASFLYLYLLGSCFIF